MERFSSLDRPGCNLKNLRGMADGGPRKSTNSTSLQTASHCLNVVSGSLSMSRNWVEMARQISSRTWIPSHPKSLVTPFVCGRLERVCRLRKESSINLINISVRLAGNSEPCAD